MPGHWSLQLLKYRISLLLFSVPKITFFSSLHYRAHYLRIYQHSGGFHFSWLMMIRAIIDFFRYASRFLISVLILLSLPSIRAIQFTSIAVAAIARYWPTVCDRAPRDIFPPILEEGWLSPFVEDADVYIFFSYFIYIASRRCFCSYIFIIIIAAHSRHFQRFNSGRPRFIIARMATLFHYFAQFTAPFLLLLISRLRHFHWWPRKRRMPRLIFLCFTAHAFTSDTRSQIRDWSEWILLSELPH